MKLADRNSIDISATHEVTISHQMTLPIVAPLSLAAPLHSIDPSRCSSHSHGVMAHCARRPLRAF